MYSSRYTGLVFWNIIQKRSVYHGLWSTVVLGSAPADHTGERPLCCCGKYMLFFLVFCAGLLLFRGIPELVALGLVYLVKFARDSLQIYFVN